MDFSMMISKQGTSYKLFRIKKILLPFFLISTVSAFAAAQKDGGIPHLKKQGTATQLIVDGKPFLMIGGEIGNSNASDMSSMKWIWPRLKTIGMNVVLVPIYWELIEPAEGNFNFSLVDSLIKDARRNTLRLVFLWFGSWKNSMSCYAPLWIKTDQQRFPRSLNKEGKGMEILTPFSVENRNADACVFRALMKHIREVDQRKHTVIMIQVENEIGMIPNARDYRPASNTEFSKPVPEDLINYLIKNKKLLIPEFYKMWEKTEFKTAGTWKEVFGDGLGTDEIFMAWHYAKYVNDVCEKGKAEYPLPMYVNAALVRPGYEPGKYPSAGPLPHLMNIWRAGAPSIDFFSPDIYFSNFSEWCQNYNRIGNPLFIPEAGLDVNTAANAFYAFGEHDAMGFSPFSIENLNDQESSKFSKTYDVIHQLTPLILESQGKDLMRGVLLDEEHKTTTVDLGDYKFHVAHDFTFEWSKKSAGPWPRTGGIIISVSRDEFYIAGSGIIVTFESNSPGDSLVGIGRIDEGKFINGAWTAGRRLNGDQSHQGRHLRIPNDDVSIQKIKLYRYH
jgi:hypothetical protein